RLLRGRGARRGGKARREGNRNLHGPARATRRPGRCASARHSREPVSDFSAYLGTRPVAEAHRFDVAALERYMRENVEGFRGPLRVEQFKGGQSNPTYRLV